MGREKRREEKRREEKRREEKKKETNLPNAFPYSFLQHTETTHTNKQNKHNAPQYMSQWVFLLRSGFMAPLQTNLNDEMVKKQV